MAELIDTFGRIARDMRVSLTDRCNLRCSYCMPAEGLGWLPTEEVLTDAEVGRILQIAVERLGVTKLRFTGGEPLLRPGLARIIEYAGTLRTPAGERPELALTTNALGLDKRLPSLLEAGLDRVNISLDSLDRERYARLARRDRLPDVLKSIQAVDDAGLRPVKINAVIMPGQNEQDILPLAQFCLSRGYQLRFIEQMPLGPQGAWEREGMVTEEGILAVLATAYELKPNPVPRGAAPAQVWQVFSGGEHVGELGVIASVTKPFCGDCDRTRITADGQVRACLFSQREADLRTLMRSGATDDDLIAAWAGEHWLKPRAHGISDPKFVQPSRTMSAIGG